MKNYLVTQNYKKPDMIKALLIFLNNINNGEIIEEKGEKFYKVSCNIDDSYKELFNSNIKTLEQFKKKYQK